MTARKELMYLNGPRRDKTCLRGSDKVRFKPACSATETSQKIEISLIASLDMLVSNKQKNKGADQTARMHRLVCAFVVRKTPKTDFPGRGSNVCC